MIGKINARIVEYFLKQKIVFILALSSIVALLVYGTLQLRINQDIYAVFPNNEKYQEFSKVIQKNQLSKQIIFSIEASESDEDTYTALDDIKRKLEETFRGSIGAIVFQRDVNERQLINYYQRISPIFFTKTDYDSIAKSVTKENIRLRLEEDAERLRGSSVLFLKNIIAKDPLGLFNRQLQSMNPVNADSNFEIHDGIVFLKSEKRALIFATLLIDQKETKALEALEYKLNAFQGKQNRIDKGLKLDHFGTFQIAVENAQQVKIDSWLTSIISVGLIVLLLILYFRSVLAPIYFILPAIFGVFSGLGLTGWIHPEISGISIATASVLLGIVLDYSFHFFTHYKHSGDLIKTVKDISSPMLLGSFTTITTLGALLFTDSVILQNFGLIALFTLSGSVIFTLLFLPVLTNYFKRYIPNVKEGQKEKTLSKRAARLALISISILTGVFWYHVGSTKFDADLHNLSFHSDELKTAEERYTGILPGRDKKFYIVVRAHDRELALEENTAIFKKLKSIEHKHQIHEIVSLAPYLIPDKEFRTKQNEWIQFWMHRKDSVTSIIQALGKENGFSEKAFVPFYNSIEINSLNPQEEGWGFAQNLGLNKLYSEDQGECSIITTVVVDAAHIDAVKAEIHKINGAYIMDISELAQSMLDSVRSDFNYLLLFSALLVFITLLIVYGRIELALLSFLPMVLSWTWILGIVGWTGIAFNFVNIIVATFIFGLGDDFSIFTTDGLIQRNRTGKSAMGSSRSAIILSGVTTLIGTGALIFAKHPAIHSIAFISIVGIGTILFISLYVQPILFDWMVTKRKQRNRVPITFFTLLYSLGLFIYFFIGSILLNIFLIVILIPFPAKKKSKRKFLNYLVSKLAKSTLYAGVYIKKKVHHAEKLDFSKPKILVANHSSFLDILLVLMLHPKALIMVKSWVYNSPVFGLFIRYAGYPFAKEGAAEDIESIRQLINDGYSIVIFPEGTRSIDGNMNRFHKGAFYLAKELGIEIQPLLIIGAHEVNPKNDVMISRGELHVKALDPIAIDENEEYSALTKRVKRMMVNEMHIAKKEIATSTFWSPLIVKNYILKGPVLEWYVRIKWMFERKNFEHYDDLIGERMHICDMGCGYGYLSYYLHYRNPNRIIEGYDFDEDKIDVANQGLRHSNGLLFKPADIRTHQFSAFDVLFLNDVLHYISKEDRIIVWKRIIESMNDNGLILIREGVQDEAKTHKMTALTEFFSTKLFRFNKSDVALDFLTIEEIEQFAKENKLTFDMHAHSTKTSNKLFILRKK
jgi:1-acyl-sn-glycerol-3-phosphate acyltransferase